MIGADLFWYVLSSEQISLGKNVPVLQNTKFGWIVTGPLGKIQQNDLTSCNFGSTIEQQIQEDLKKFWEIESLECSVKGFSQEEIAIEKHFIANTKRNEKGEFIVRLPLKMDISKLGSSRAQATKRFLSLEKRLLKDNNISFLYHDFTREYIQLGHMTKINNSKTDMSLDYFMCHHGVYRQHALTTNLRVVFDASLPSSTGYSLNNIQMVGPIIQQDLVSILMRFTQHSVVFAANCSKMYRSVWVALEDRVVQKILWRFNTNSTLDTYELNTVTYGTAAASFLAIRCLFQLAYDIENDYPVVANIIKSDFYVDDLLTGFESKEDAKQIISLINNVLKQGSFVLRKFYSNDPSVLVNIPHDDPLSKIVEFEENDNKKTLGLIWCPSQDKLMYSVKEDFSSSVISKRTILSESSKVFDPLGLVSPCIIIVKMLLQHLWLKKLSWDDQVPQSIVHTIWKEFKSQLVCLNELRIDRHVVCPNYQYVEMHCFSESSEKAYGACIYLKSLDIEGQVFVNLLTSKAKVAPLQSISLPRLELCGALTSARLANKVSKALRLIVVRRVFWLTQQLF
ncbi:uncharacterized protein LOC126740449 [Anthonomus grandis grandis]|uniref:uncharacterized protein LOC126740449 n=1 Tax=Anthonomus grandis grandis TaxID=2921223 RepID=UPI002165AAAB|nr:uncharacterized protein LOC126740449 [Anthonomus grandis grandis]